MSASENTAPWSHGVAPVGSTDVDDEPVDDSTDEEPRVYAPRLSSRGSTVLGAAMMGLQIGMYGEVDKPEITIEADANIVAAVRSKVNIEHDALWRISTTVEGDILGGKR